MQCGDYGLISTSGTHTMFTTKPTSLYPSITTRFPTRVHFHFGSLKVRAMAQKGSSMKPISKMSFYELLGISETVSLPDIKKAYKQLARKYHPDVSPPDCVVEYTDRFIRVQQAYETLSDPNTRALYDRDLARGLDLAFSARKEMEDKSSWRSSWQEQLSELKRRSMYKAAGKNMSWGARMRQQRTEASAEL